MTMLCDKDIEYEITTGHVVINPYDPKLLQPASLDVRLGKSFVSVGDVDYDIEGTYTSPAMICLPPHELILGHTLEAIKVPRNLAVRIEGKSSWGRRGLLVHLTAGFIDPGFEGEITLELFNLTRKDIRVKIGEPIAQLSFHRLSAPAETPYGSPSLGSRYQHQRGATVARKSA